MHEKNPKKSRKMNRINSSWTQERNIQRLSEKTERHSDLEPAGICPRFFLAKYPSRDNKNSVRLEQWTPQKFKLRI